MITFQEHAERDCRDRCQLIDSLLRGDGKIISYEVDVSQLKKSYVGFAAKVLNIIRKGGATRNEIKDATNVEFQVIEKVVKKLKSDKTIKETPGVDNRRMLQVIK
tara:strand:- start:133 stop:447 length:315 start_codon:yes stop_codon:yes gene_type:complete